MLGQEEPIQNGVPSKVQAIEFIRLTGDDALTVVQKGFLRARGKKGQASHSNPSARNRRPYVPAQTLVVRYVCDS